MEHINLETFANGAFTEQVNRAVGKVMKNIQDPNTDAKAVRKVVVTIAFKPNDMRNFIATGVVTKTSLAPELGAVTAMTCGTNLDTGEVNAMEIGSQIPGQMSIQDEEIQDGGDVQIGDVMVDSSTGEVKNSKVMDIRDVRAI